MNPDTGESDAITGWNTDSVLLVPGVGGIVSAVRTTYKCSSCTAFFESHARLCPGCMNQYETRRETCINCGSVLVDAPVQRCPVCGSGEIERS